MTHFNLGTVSSGSSGAAGVPRTWQDNWDGTFDGAWTNMSELSLTGYTTNTGSLIVTAIGNDKALLVWEDSGNKIIRCVVLTRSGTTVTAGSEAVVYDHSSDSGVPTISVCALENDKALVFYAQTIENIYYANIVTVSGTTPTVNTQYIVASIGANRTMGCCMLSSAKAVVSYVTSGTVRPQAMVLDISGTVITTNTAVQVFGAAPDTLGPLVTNVVSAASATQVLFCGISSASNTASIAASISGSTITMGTAVVHTTNAGRTTNVVQAGAATGGMNISRQNSSPTYIRVYPYTLSGTTITNFTTLRTVQGASNTMSNPAAIEMGSGIGPNPGNNLSFLTWTNSTLGSAYGSVIQRTGTNTLTQKGPVALGKASIGVASHTLIHDDYILTIDGSQYKVFFNGNGEP
jgi:hypothetical protein